MKAILAATILAILGVAAAPAQSQNRPTPVAIAEAQPAENILELDLIDEKGKTALFRQLDALQTTREGRRTTIPEAMEKNRAEVLLLRKQFRQTIIDIAEKNYAHNTDPRILELVDEASTNIKNRQSAPEDLIFRGLDRNNKQHFLMGTAYSVLLEINKEFQNMEAVTTNRDERRDLFLRQAIYVSELCRFLAEEVDYLSTQGIDDIKNAVTSKKAWVASKKRDIEEKMRAGSANDRYRAIWEGQLFALDELNRVWTRVEQDASNQEELLAKLKSKKADFMLMASTADDQVEILEEARNAEIVLTALKQMNELAELEGISILVLPVDFLNEYFNAETREGR